MSANQNHEKIEALIQQSTDPVLQATLFLIDRLDSSMQRTAQALDANTAATERIASKTDNIGLALDKHILDEERMLSGFRWGWWSVTGMGGAVLLLGGYIVMSRFDVQDRESIKLREVEQRQQVVVQRVETLERAVNQLLDRFHNGSAR